MKKFVWFAIFVAALVGYAFRSWIFSRLHYRLPAAVEQIAGNPAVESLLQDVQAPPPLRAGADGQNGELTVNGIIVLTNARRTENGQLSALAENAELDAAARAKVADMFARQYFEHVSPDGKGPAELAEASGYRFAVIGENLALGNFKDDNDLIQAWMDSPGHRANMLNSRYEEIGVAVGKGTYEGRTVWLAVQEFGKPASSCPAVDQQLKSEIDSYSGDLAALEPQLEAIKNDLAAQNPRTGQEIAAYNAKVAQYNDLVKNYDNKLDVVKNLVNDYNAQVKARNACVGQ